MSTFDNNNMELLFENHVKIYLSKLFLNNYFEFKDAVILVNKLIKLIFNERLLVIKMFGSEF